MAKVFVDTGGWVALFAGNDGRHSAAVGIFDRLRHDRATLYTSDYVVDETLTLIRSRVGHSAAMTAGQALFESNLVKMVFIAPDHIPGAWKIFGKFSDKNFSFTDASTLTVLNTLKIEKLFGFDAEFKKVGIELLP